MPIGVGLLCWHPAGLGRNDAWAYSDMEVAETSNICGLCTCVYAHGATWSDGHTG